MRMHRSIGGVVGAGVAILVAWGGVAFACTAQAPEVYSTLPESGAPGSTVTVRGYAVRSESPVQIRWDGVGGAHLATAAVERGRFSVPVQVPTVAPGVYSLTLVTVDGLVSRTAFEVTGLAGSAPARSTRLWPSASTGVADPAPAGQLTTLGVGLLAVGLVGLFAGSAVAVTSRRRVPVESRR